LMAIPRQSPTHRKGVIGLALGRRNEPDGHFAFRTVAEQPEAVTVLPGRGGEEETLCMRPTAGGSFPPRVHFSTYALGGVSALSVEIRVEPSPRGAAVLALGAEMNSMLMSEGIRLRFRRGRIRVWMEPSHPAGLPHRLSARLGRYLAPGPRRGWRALGRYAESEWLRLSITRRAAEWTFDLNGQKLGSLPGRGASSLPIHDIAFQSSGPTLQVRNLRVLRDA
jgi:hypothetical protein